MSARDEAGEALTDLEVTRTVEDPIGRRSGTASGRRHLDFSDPSLLGIGWQSAAVGHGRARRHLSRKGKGRPIKLNRDKLLPVPLLLLITSLPGRRFFLPWLLLHCSFSPLISIGFGITALELILLHRPATLGLLFGLGRLFCFSIRFFVPAFWALSQRVLLVIL